MGQDCQREWALAEAAEEGADVWVRGASGEEASARADAALAVLGRGARCWASAGVRSGPCGEWAVCVRWVRSRAGWAARRVGRGEKE